MAKRRHHSEEEIIRILKEAEAGMPWRIYFANTISRKEPFTAGRAFTVGCKSTELRRLKELEKENERLKRLAAFAEKSRALLGGQGGMNRLATSTHN